VTQKDLDLGKTDSKLNHLFNPGESKPSPAECRKPGHVNPEVLADLSAWIARTR
jgi:hypothetical protein